MPRITRSVNSIFNLPKNKCLAAVSSSLSSLAFRNTPTLRHQHSNGPSFATTTQQQSRTHSPRSPANPPNRPVAPQQRSIDVDQFDTAVPSNVDILAEMGDLDCGDPEERRLFAESLMRCQKVGPEAWDGLYSYRQSLTIVFRMNHFDPHFNLVPMKHRHIGYAVEKALKAQPNPEAPCSIAAVMRALSDDVKELLGEEGLSLKQFAEMYPRKFFIRLHPDESRGFEIMLADVFASHKRAAGGTKALKKGQIDYVSMEMQSKSRGSNHEMKTRTRRAWIDNCCPVISSAKGEFHPVPHIPLVKLLKLSDEEKMFATAHALELGSRLREIRPLLTAIARVEKLIADDAASNHQIAPPDTAANANKSADDQNHNNGGCPERHDWASSNDDNSSNAATPIKCDPREYYRTHERFGQIVSQLEKMFSIDKEMIYLYAVPKTWRQHAMKGFEAFDVAMTKWRLAMAEYNKNPVGPAPRPNITGPRPPPSRIPILEGMDVVDALKNLTINPASFHIYASLHPSYEYLEDVPMKMKAERMATDATDGPNVVYDDLNPTTVRGIPLVEQYDRLRVARYLPVTSFMPIGELIGRAGHVTQQSMLHVLLSAPHYFRFEKDESTCGSGPKYNEKGELQPNFKYLKSVQFVLHTSYIPPELMEGTHDTLQSTRARLDRIQRKIFDVRTRRTPYKLELTRLHIVLYAMQYLGGLNPYFDLEVAAMAVYDALYERVGTQRICLSDKSILNIIPPFFVKMTFCRAPRFFNAFPLLFRMYELPPDSYVECVDSTNFGHRRDDVPEDTIRTEEQIIDIVKQVMCECQTYSARKGREDPFASHVWGRLPRFVSALIRRRHGNFLPFLRQYSDHFDVQLYDNDSERAIVRIKGLGNPTLPPTHQ